MTKIVVSNRYSTMFDSADTGNSTRGIYKGKSIAKQRAKASEITPKQVKARDIRSRNTRPDTQRKGKTKLSRVGHAYTVDKDMPTERKHPNAWVVSKQGQPASERFKVQERIYDGHDTPAIYAGKEDQGKFVWEK